MLLSEIASGLTAEAGTIVVASPRDVLAVAMDKWQRCRFLEGAGLRFPKYARANVAEEVERLIDELGLPLIAKLVRGTGSRGSLTIESLDGLGLVPASGVAMAVQEYLYPDSEEYSVEVYTLKDGQQAGAISYHRRQLVAGDTYKALVSHSSAEAEAREVASALGTAGPCNVQLRITARGPVTFEINRNSPAGSRCALTSGTTKARWRPGSHPQ